MSSNISYVQEPYTHTGKLYYTLPGIYNKILEGLVRSTFVVGLYFQIKCRLCFKKCEKSKKSSRKYKKKTQMSPPFLARMLLSKSPGNVFIEGVGGTVMDIGMKCVNICVFFITITIVIHLLFIIIELFSLVYSYTTTKHLPDDDCSVCLEPLKSAYCVQLGCGHHFHRTCAQTWHRRSYLSLFIMSSSY